MTDNRTSLAAVDLPRLLTELECPEGARVAEAVWRRMQKMEEALWFYEHAKDNGGVAKSALSFDPLAQ